MSRKTKLNLNLKASLIALVAVFAMVVVVMLFTGTGTTTGGIFEKKPGYFIKCDANIKNPWPIQSTVLGQTNCYVAGDCFLGKKKTTTQLAALTDYGTIRATFGNYKSEVPFAVSESLTGKNVQYTIEVCSDERQGNIVLFDQKGNVLGQVSDYAE
jgi:hypothetical protein